MTDRRKGEWWKAALLSGAISAIVGPGIGTAIILLKNVFVTNAFQAVIGFLWYWLIGVVSIGPAAFVLGGAGGVLLKALATRCRSMVTVLFIAAALGLTLGSTVLVGMVVLWKLLNQGHFANTNWDATRDGAGAVAGLVCAISVLCLLIFTKLLHLSRTDVKSAG